MKQDSSKIVTVHTGNTVLSEDGVILDIPPGWIFYPAGDAGITRKITASGVYWRVQIKVGRRTISKGVWAPSRIVEEAVSSVTGKRGTDEYKCKKESAVIRRDKKQKEYEAEFYDAVVKYLNFADCYREYEAKLAENITIFATPVGSKTVARTTMIPVDERAAKAVMAWMRHKTTNYDDMKIRRVKGERRAVRRTLLSESILLLQRYRKGEPLPSDCRLKKALGF